ncbi:MAG: FIST domain containing protein, partial [Nitrospinae bacterium]|nr:FIST domain containing protein [Nitrospinota bacterium]
MTTPLTIRKGHSNNRDTLQAFEEVAAQIEGSDTAGILLFASSKLDLDALGPAMAARFSAPILACSTAGELSPLGYPDHSLSAVSLGGPGIVVEPHYIKDVRSFAMNDSLAIGTAIRQTLDRLGEKRPGAWRTFGLLLIDGLSVAEESVAAHLSGALEGIPFVGGSAGDDLGFAETYVYHEGRFVPGGGVFGAFYTTHPFVTFKTQHFVPVEEDKLVITEADPENRIVREINGMPAAEEYAR